MKARQQSLLANRSAGQTEADHVAADDMRECSSPAARLGRAVAGEDRAQPAFLTQNLHHPVGLIVPSTKVQAPGG
jgi:hypothetical protein